MEKLIAQQSILFEGTIYDPGEELPTKNPAMTEAWLEAGTAVWVDDKAEDTKVEAKPCTAETGLPGAAPESEAEDGDNLAGKVPKTNARKKK